ncbi:MAG: hypothetical protein B6242_10650 [Anaerolineaceae bacterium 4572_78]|nr:MAG: hypothetical protein B6242_10650 [Anaerolineaceae bacterium 4572_78]
MKIAIIGTGAMACLFASRLSQLADVVMLGTWQYQLTMLQTKGLLVNHPDGSQTHHHFEVGANLCNHSIDLALILVKAHQTKRAGTWANRILRDDGLALTLQNGLGNAKLLSTQIDEERVAVGITSQGAMVIEPGVLKHAGEGATYLAYSPSNHKSISNIADLFNQAGFETHLVDNLTNLIWGKLIINVGINPLTALLDVPNGFLAENEFARNVMSRAVQEAVAVAHAQGIELPYTDAVQRTLEVCRHTATNRSSMLQDLSRHAPTEIEVISGVIISLGRQFGIHTPVNAMLYDLIRAAQDSSFAHIS